MVESVRGTRFIPMGGEHSVIHRVLLLRAHRAAASDDTTLARPVPPPPIENQQQTRGMIMA